MTMAYDLWLIPYDHGLWLMTYTLWLWLMTMTSILWLWLSHITRDYDLSPLMTFISYHLSSITITYDLWPIPQNHHLWLIIHNSSHMSMISHPWLLYMTIIHDLSHLWLSGLLPMTITYDLWLWSMTYDLWPMTYDYHLSPITVTHDYPWLWLITCHSWLIQNHDWSHMIIAHDYQGLSLMTIKDYHSWLSSMTMNSTYEHHLWPSDLMTYDSSPVSITQDCYPWLSSMTMNITHDYAHHMTYHSWPWLPPMTMTATHDYEYHSQSTTTHD